MSERAPFERWDAAASIPRPRRRRLRRLPYPRREGGGVSCVALALLAAFIGLGLAGQTPSSLDHFVRRTRDRVVASLELYSLARSVQAYCLAEGRLPTDLREVLQASRRRLRGRPEWVDPWGQDYVIQKLPDGFCLRSAGPDRHLFNGDDLTCRVTMG